MSNVIVQGWEWLEAELHKALEIVHQSTPPDGLKHGAKSAVSAVISAARAVAIETAKDEALKLAEATLAAGANGVEIPEAAAVLEALAEGAVGVVAGGVESIVGPIVDTDEPGTKAAEGTAPTADSEKE